MGNRVLVLTGDGRGKTTSSLGMVLRAVGHGLRVCVVQFIKRAADETGEARALKLLPGVEHHMCGRGFVMPCGGEKFETHAQAAQGGLALAAEKLRDPSFNMVVLDEVCSAAALGLVAARDVCDAVASAAPGTVIILTGRDACPELIALGDTVSRIECVKHAYDSGVAAQVGVEW